MKTRTVWKCNYCKDRECAFICVGDTNGSKPDFCPLCLDRAIDEDWSKVSECELPEMEKYKEEEK